MLKNWKLSAIAAFSLTIAMALGILAAALSDLMLLRPPLAANPATLVSIFTDTPKNRFEKISYPDYEYYRDHSRAFSGIAAYPNSIGLNSATFENHYVMLSTCAVSDNYFSVMGIKPVAGRFFEEGDDRKQTPVVVLTYAGWKRFHRDPNIIGKQLFYGHDPRTIIGIAPKNFKGAAFGFEADLISHFSSDETGGGRGQLRLVLLGRLKPGVSLPQARAELDGLSRQLAAAYPKEDHDRVASLMPARVLAPGDASDARMISALLTIIIFFILLIACANAANLLLAIATGRRKEALIKTALGASRARLIREFLIETGALCLISAVCGCGLAWVVIAKFSEFETRLPGFGKLRLAADLHIDWVVIGASAAMVMVACLATGIAPALYGSSVNVASALTGEVAIGGTRKGVIRNGLVIVQVAVSTLVLMGVALSFRSLQNLRNVDPGFSARNLAGIMAGKDDRNFTEAKAHDFYRSLREAAEKLPGVEAVTLAAGMPLNLGGSDADIRTETAETLHVQGGTVDDDFFSTVGIRLLAGRAFDASDTKARGEVVVISRELAKRLWRDATALGQTIHFADGKRTARVIGVVADIKLSEIDEAPKPFLYFPLSQSARPYITLIVRTSGSPRLWIEPLARSVMKLDVVMPVPPVTLDDVLDLTVLVNIWIFEAVSGISALALLLAVLGLFGAVSYAVGERRRELGVRIALGALPSQLMTMILRSTGIVAGSGILIGVAMGVATTVLLRSQLYGIHAVEWTALVPVSVVMLAIACTVAFMAARGATYMDPMRVLRHN